jgi:hypothetical protein
MKLLGRKDVAEFEKQTSDERGFVEHSQTRTLIRGIFLSLAFLLAVGVIIAPVLFVLGSMLVARYGT